MTLSMFKMYFSFAGMIFLFLAMFLIWLGRYKLKGWIGKIVSFIAFLCLMLGGIIIVLVVFTGPTA